MDVDPYTGKQWAFEGFGGHAVGHADGILETQTGKPLLEIKSMNANKFKEFSTKGVKFSHNTTTPKFNYVRGEDVFLCLYCYKKRL